MKEFLFSEQWYWVLLIAFISYLIGGISAARIISGRKNEDVTKKGSGNPGTMNMTRVYGVKLGALTLFLDALKGAIPVLVVHLIYRDYTIADTGLQASDWLRYVSGLFVVIGHIYPVFNRFHGGKGIATTLGVFWVGLACESLWFALVIFVGLVCMILYIALTEWAGMGSLFGISLCVIIQLSVFIVDYGMDWSLWLVAIFANVVGICFFDWFAHRKNVVRLLSGEEHRTPLGALAKKAFAKKKDTKNS
ncbi:MAG: glycerol-3-phosphate acyltransferase [Clostridia bacterium]|nr:glycerol-3-phosphate acyltransferase [Clostridia bacterium]